MQASACSDFTFSNRACAAETKDHPPVRRTVGWCGGWCVPTSLFDHSCVFPSLTSGRVVLLCCVYAGEKYVVRGILFKLAHDSELAPDYFLYGGSNGPHFELAAKAAGHDLKGAISYFRFCTDGICVPMQALVDFQGFRLIAMPLLPLRGHTPIYGSNDGGASVHASNPVFNAMMERAAKMLHIAPHRVAAAQTVLCSAGDVEGHLGTDNRFHLLDLVRRFAFAHFALAVANHS